MADFDFEHLKRDLLDGVSAAANGMANMAGQAAEAVQEAAKDTHERAVNYRDFRRFGYDLATSGMVSSHGGNMSLTDGSRIWVTRTGSMLGHLGPKDILCVNWQPDAELDANASMELKVHRAMYQAAAAGLAEGQPLGQMAIVHAHSLYTTLHSLFSNTIMPLDSEGVYLLGASVPVLTPQQAVASDEVAALMADVVRKGGKLGIVRGHGPFVLADSLENAYRLVSALEYSTHMLTLVDQYGRSVPMR